MPTHIKTPTLAQESRVLAAFKAACATVPGVLFQPLHGFRADGVVKHYAPAAYVPNTSEAAFIAAMDAAGVYVMDRMADTAHVDGFRGYVRLDPFQAMFYVPMGTLDTPAGHALKEA